MTSSYGQAGQGRVPIVGGNWKMHTTRDEARVLLRRLVEDLDGLGGVEVVLFPPAPWLAWAADVLEGTSLRLGAQNVYWEPSGAFTGEASAAMLAGTVTYALVGHSERRWAFGETEDETNRKLRSVLDAGLKPVLAVGERHDEREAGRTSDVLRLQLTTAFEGIDRLPAGFVVAYEPVWAIGTGLTATPEIAEEACAEVRALVAQRFDSATADATRIQYGGSVKADNIEAIAEQPDIDGALVGGASLDAGEFAAICRAVAAAGAAVQPG